MFALHHRQRSPRLFTRNPVGTFRTLLLIAACITLMFYDHQRGHLQKIHAALSTLVYPMQAAVNAPYALASWAKDTLVAHSALVSENARLRKQLLLDTAQLQQTAALQQENARLRELMHSSAALSGHVVLADMLAVDTDPFRHLIVIDKGADNGVYDGQTLLDAHGIVGQVIQVGPVSAQVALITDPSQAIQVQINRTNQRTLAVGGADVDDLSLPYLTNDTDVKTGDLLVTSGLGGRYPAGYPVAVVTQVHRDPAEPFASVSAHAVANLDHGHEVLLYFPATPQPPALKLRSLEKPRAPGKKPK